jgi:hypothetical protein
MRLTRDNPALLRWRWWFAALIAAEAGWFALLWQRFTATFSNIVVLGLLPLTVVGYVYLMVAVSAFLSDLRWDYRFRQVIVLILGLSVGCFVLALLWLAKVHFEPEAALIEGLP